MSISFDDTSSKKDKLWSYLLNEIKINLSFLNRIVHEHEEIYPPTNKNTSAVSQYQYLMSQLADISVLSSSFTPKNPNICDVNLAQVASDFAEAYSQRLGVQAGRALSLTVDHTLPIVRTSPETILSIVDCLARAAHRASTNRRVEIILRQSTKLSQDPDRCEIVLVCKGISFATSPNRLQELIALFSNGDYLPCVRELGLELCTALHIARSLNTLIYAVQENTGRGTIELRFQLEKSNKVGVRQTVPQTFYVHSESEWLKETVSSFADYYGNQVKVVTNPEEVPTNHCLIYDATDYTPETTNKLKSLPSPATTTLILSSASANLWRELAAYGFRQFTTLPLVSTRLLQSIRGSAVYQKPVNTDISSSKQKLRVLVVDDAATARIVIKDYFEALGHGVFEASDGTEFIAQIKQGIKFDIIFCDLNMSNIDGGSAVKVVRELEQKSNSRTPIVLMTAYSSDDAQSYTDLGFDKVLEKPIGDQQLSDVLDELVYKKKIVSSAGPETKIINVEDLKMRCSNKTSTMIKVLESFITTSKVQLLKLKSEEVQCDQVLQAKMIHMFKGLLRDIGAISYATEIESIERRLNEGDGDISLDLPKIEQIINSACEKAGSLKSNLEISH